MTTRLLMLAGVLAACAAQPAAAQQNTFKLGISSVQPRATTGEFSGPFTPAGIRLAVRDRTTPFLSYSRALDAHWGVELALGLPPTHDIALDIRNPALPGNAQALSGQVAARVRQIAPTVFVNYTFLAPASAVRPFVGAGINYTHFDKARSTAAGDALDGGPTSVELKDSTGLALQAGLGWRIDDRWSLWAALATARVKSQITTNTLGVERRSDIRFRPRVLVLALGYAF